jgi:hypothetical protein
MESQIMDMVWILTALFVTALAIAVILGHIHGTFI